MSEIKVKEGELYLIMLGKAMYERFFRGGFDHLDLFFKL